MRMSNVGAVLCLLGVLGVAVEGQSCPRACSCSALEAVRPKARCGPPLTLLASLQLVTFPNTSLLSILDLSGNNLTHLPTRALFLQNLQKLDLNKNHIEQIDDGAFSGLPSLKRLDLSNNRIVYISQPMFTGLINLERLKLSQNLISHIKEGTFDGLDSLKQLDVTLNKLVCDCELWWLVGWESVKLAPVPKCFAPPQHRGHLLRKLSPQALLCPWLYDTFPLLELSPQHDQVVFEGDPLVLECRAGSGALLPESKVAWSWAGLAPHTVFTSSVRIRNKLISDSGLLESWVVIDRVGTEHKGEWSCELVSAEGNHSSALSVIVISHQTKYCPPTVTVDNKGEYRWPKTVGGHSVEVGCKAELGVGNARHVCSVGGTWTQLNTSVCPFISETTRILQQYARMNLSSGRTSLVESGRRLYNYTVDNKDKLTDPMDIVFITQTIHNYLPFVEKEKELGGLVLEVVSLALELEGRLLAEAEREDGSASKLVAAVEAVTPYTPSLQSHKSKMAVEEFRVSRESFVGLTCSWWNSRDRRPSERLFHCSTTNTSAVLATSDKVLEASIQVPASVLHQVEGGATTHQLMVAMYDSAKLFPPPPNYTIASYVVGTKLVGVEVGELVNSVTVMLGGGEGGRVSPVWWDPQLAEWVHGLCDLSYVYSDLLVLHCRRLGYFALLREPPLPQRREQAMSRVSPVSSYVGSFVGSTCLVVATFTYLVCHASIQMSARLKHALANSWLAIAYLAILFSIGVYQTGEVRLCRAIGLSIHYLTLAVLFWMAVTINCVHRGVRKRGDLGVGGEGSSTTEEEEGEGGGGGGGGRVGLYLVGWGVPALLVGLSGAVHPAGYAAPRYCSLTPGPAFTPLLLPLSALLVFILTRALMVRSAASEKDSNAQLSEGTQATDLELLESGGTVGGGGGVEECSVATPSSRVEDPEQGVSLQLRGYLVVLTLFSLTWLCGALSVLQPLGLPHEEIAFATAYACFIVLLGTFVVFFYCFSRSDVRAVWFTLRPVVRSRNVRDSVVGPPSRLVHPPPKHEPPPPLNLVDLHRRQYTNSVITNATDSFYNPHQSVAAKKFFKRQRRKRGGSTVRREVPTPSSPADSSQLFRPAPHTPSVPHPPSHPPHHHPHPPLYASVASECCSCVVSEVHSTTDCTRDLTSEHSSRSSHLYATVAPDPPLHDEEDKKETSV